MGCWEREQVELVANSVGPSLAQRIINNLKPEIEWNKLARMATRPTTPSIQVPVQLADISRDIQRQDRLVPVAEAKIFLELARCDDDESLSDFLKSLASAN